MRTSTLTALAAALASDDPSHQNHSHQFSNGRLQLYPSSNINHNAVLQSSQQYQAILDIRGGDAAGGRVGVSFGEILADNKPSYKISATTNPSVIVRGGDDKSSTTATSSNNGISIFGGLWWCSFFFLKTVCKYAFRWCLEFRLKHQGYAIFRSQLGRSWPACSGLRVSAKRPLPLGSSWPACSGLS